MLFMKKLKMTVVLYRHMKEKSWAKWRELTLKCSEILTVFKTEIVLLILNVLYSEMIFKYYKRIQGE